MKTTRANCESSTHRYTCLIRDTLSRGYFASTLSFVFPNENQTKSALLYITFIYFSEFGFSPSARGNPERGV